MSGHQEYKCPKCGCEWETLEAPNCPTCSSLAAPAGSAVTYEISDKAYELVCECGNKTFHELEVIGGKLFECDYCGQCYQ